MKTAIYIEDGRMQLVLTPDSEFERTTLKAIAAKKKSVTIQEGQFYACKGGWTRYNDHPQDKQSLIVVLDNAPEPSND